MNGNLSWYKKRSKKGRVAFWVLLYIMLLALVAPFIAGNQFHFSPVKYNPYSPDYANSNFVSPLHEQFDLKDGKREKLSWSKWHWLGTNKLGEDVLSGIIHGARISMVVGFCSMLIATVIGLILGMCAGYFGNHLLTLKKGEIILLAIGLIPSFFYAGVVADFFPDQTGKLSALSFLGQITFVVMVFLVILFLFFRIGKAFSRIHFFSSKHFVPVDHLIMRITEVVISLPTLILIFACAALITPSVFNLILIIGIISWAEIARIVRSETLKIKSQGYVDATRVLGFNHSRIIFRHILPNVLPVIGSMSLFVFANAVLAEASLSFLGIGIPYQTVTWGTLLASAREEISAWWLIVFPGFMLAATLMSLHTLREEMGR